MRAAAVTGSLVAALALGACGDDGTTLGTISIDEDLPATTVRGAGPVAGGVIPAALPPVALDVESTEAYEAGDYASITSISIRALSLAVTEGSENASTDTFEDGMPDDLSFLSALEVYIVATIDGVQRTELLGNVPENDPRLDAGARTVALDMTGVDILDYVEADGGYEVGIQVSGMLPPDDVTFDGEVTYRVGVGFR